MLENFVDEMEEIEIINKTYKKDLIGRNAPTETNIKIEALVTNGRARLTQSSGQVEFVDYLKVHYETGDIKKGDEVIIRGAKYRAAKPPREYQEHKMVEVVYVE